MGRQIRELVEAHDLLGRARQVLDDDQAHLCAAIDDGDWPDCDAEIHREARKLLADIVGFQRGVDTAAPNPDRDTL